MNRRLRYAGRGLPMNGWFKIWGARPPALGVFSKNSRGLYFRVGWVATFRLGGVHRFLGVAVLFG